MISIIAALAPVLAKLIFVLMENKKVDAENKKKFLDAIQSIDALKSKNMKKKFDELESQMESVDQTKH